MNFKNETLQKIYEAIYFSVLICILIITYSEITMFRNISTFISYIALFRFALVPLVESLFLINILLIVFRRKFCINKDCPLYWHPSEIIVALISIVVFLIPYLISKDDQLLWYAILIVGAHGIDYKKLLKVYVITSALLCITTFSCGIFGIIENLVYYRTDGTARIAFGFNYPTDCCSHIFFLVISWIWIREDKISIFEIIAIELFGIFTYIACNARTTTITLCALGVWLLYIKIKSKKNKYKMVKPLRFLCSISALLGCILMTLLAILYSDKNSAMRFLNHFLNSRISLSHIGFERYNITPFGQPVVMGGDDLFFLDCSFINILLRQGLLVLLLVLFVYTMLSISEKEKNKYIHLGLLGFIALQCTIEHHLLEIGHCPILLAFLSYDMETNASLIDFSAIKRIFMRKKGET